jgi:amino acid transporter
MLNKLQEIFISIVLLILLVLVWNPMHMGMRNFVAMMVVVGMVVAFAIFAIFIWRERGQDEREEMHFSFAGRIGFLAGSSVLVIGILVQSFRHALDLWLVVTLGIMVLAKVGALLYRQSQY